ncbi:glycosyltransferase [Shewanella subflava]|uniref:Glycosyltransferase n=1 Tax=Shewanella subflava TaxID=2986476 RepID=A0ABT3I720_9GAMM|nr:glycosyltransferase [Shewanella subflava]MCW3171846.1 glycosyltransferase [Shewanella subflava]
MKYIFVIRHICYGGAEASTWLLSKALASRGHTIEIWNLGNSTEDDLNRWLPFSSVKAIKKWQLLSYKVNPSELLVLVNNAAHRYAPKKGTVTIVHGDPTYKLTQSTSFIGRIKERVKLYQQHYSRNNFVISNELATRLMPFTKQSPVHLPNPFDANSVIEKAAQPCDFDLPQDFIVHIGRFGPEKKQELLLASYLENQQLNSKVDLVFIGDEPQKNGPITTKLLTMTNESDLKEKVHFLGNQSNPWNILVKAKCLVLCSEFESMGYVLLEAMALTIPIVSTTTIGAKEVLGNDFAGLVNLFPNLENTQSLKTAYVKQPSPQNTAILADKLIQVINNPQRFIKKLSDEYSVDIIADKFATLTQVDATERVHNQPEYLTTI